MFRLLIIAIVTCLVVLRPVDFVSAQGIQIPTTESVEKRLRSGEKAKIRSALRDVAIFRLPLKDRVQPFLKTTHEVDAWAAYLNAGGKPEELASYLKSLPAEQIYIEGQDRFIDQKSLALFLVREDHEIEFAVHRLFTLEFGRRDLNSLNFYAWPSCFRGSARDALIDNLLSRLANVAENMRTFLEEDFFPMTLQLRPRDFSEVVRLFENENYHVQFIASYWLLTGPFENSDFRQIEKYATPENGYARVALAGLQMRAHPDHVEADEVLRKSLVDYDPFAVRAAIIAVDSLPNQGVEYRRLVLKTLDSPYREVLRTAMTAIDRWEQPLTEDNLQQISEMCLESPHDSNASLLSLLADSERWDEIDRILETLFESSDESVRFDAAIFAASCKRTGFLSSILKELKRDDAKERAELLEELEEFPIDKDEHEIVRLSLESLLNDDRGASGFALDNKTRAARLLWSSGVDRATPLELAEEWLNSEKSSQVRAGLNLVEELGADAKPFFPTMLELATESWSYQEHISYHLWKFKGAFHDYLELNLLNFDPDARGTAAYLLLARSPRRQDLAKVFPLLEDESPITRPGFFFDEEHIVPLNVFVARSILQSARSHQYIREQLRQNNPVVEKLAKLTNDLDIEFLMKESLDPVKILSSPEPVQFDLCLEALRESMPRFFKRDRFEELLQHGIAVERIFDVLKLLETLPHRFDSGTGFDDQAWSFLYTMRKMKIRHDKAIPVLEHWISEASILPEDVRHGAAETLEAIDPENKIANEYLDRARRAFGVEMF